MTPDKLPIALVALAQTVIDLSRSEFQKSSFCANRLGPKLVARKNEFKAARLTCLGLVQADNFSASVADAAERTSSRT
jgi:hypothetical protein